MGKSSNILDGIFCVTRFRRVIWAGLMTVVFFVASCTSNPAQTPVVTTISEATATATIEPIPTLEPTPTIAPKPDYINDDNSVETDDGTVFVKDGEYMLYDPKTGEIKEIKNISTEVTFNTTADASKIVLAIHEEEFTNQEQLYKDLTPGNTMNDFTYNMGVKKAAYMGSLQEGTYLTTVGSTVEYVRIKSPLGENADFPEMGIAMLKIFGDERPVPWVVGIFYEDGYFAPFYDEVSGCTSKSYPLTINPKVIPDRLSWIEFQKMVEDDIIPIDLLFAIDPKTSSGFVEPASKYKASDHLSAPVTQERARLIQLNLKQAEWGYAYLDGPEHRKVTGNMYADLEQLLLAKKNLNFYFFSPYSFFRTVHSD